MKALPSYSNLGHYRDVQLTKEKPNMTEKKVIGYNKIAVLNPLKASSTISNLYLI